MADYPWSSYPVYLQSPSRRPVWLRVDRVLGEAGIRKDSAAGRQEFRQRMEMRRWEEKPEMWKEVRRGWALGSEAFREALLELMDERRSEYIAGEEIRETEEHKAERIVAAELARLKWTARDLEQTRKGDRRKIKIARRLRTETTMTLKWISARLHMGDMDTHRQPALPCQSVIYLGLTPFPFWSATFLG